MSENELGLPACEKCNFKRFEKVVKDIEVNLPCHSVVLVNQECFQCFNCGDVYFTEQQALEFTKKIEEGKFSKK